MSRWQRSKRAGARPSKNGRSYTENHGKPGVVYILENASLKAGLLKVGQSTRSGAARAADLNRSASTGMPANYSCVFEYGTSDCGRAELLAHSKLQQYRRGKWGQEFFEVDLETAKVAIIEACDHFNSELIDIKVETVTIFRGSTPAGPARGDHAPLTLTSSEVDRIPEDRELSAPEPPPRSNIRWTTIFLLIVGAFAIVRALMRQG